MKAFFLYTLFLAFISLLSFIFVQFLLIKANLYTVLFYTIVEYFLVSSFIRYLIVSSKIKLFIVFSWVLYTLYAFIDLFIINNIFKNPNPQLHNLLNITSSFLIIILLIYYFYEKMRSVVVVPLTQLITFWIAVSFFLYYTGTFFVFIFFNTQRSPEETFQIRYIYIFVTIIKNIILCLALFANEPTENAEELRIPDDLNLDEFTPTNPKTLS
ncbi:MAG: hypothetical protein WAT19_01585 [Ferruginibacter sp.]